MEPQAGAPQPASTPERPAAKGTTPGAWEAADSIQADIKEIKEMVRR